MTRVEAEKMIGQGLKIIREACVAYLPDFPKDLICSMYVSAMQDSAWIMEPEKEDCEVRDYLLDYHCFYDENGKEEE